MTFGEVAQIFTCQGHINEVSTTGETDWRMDRQDKAMINKNQHQQYGFNFFLASQIFKTWIRLQQFVWFDKILQARQGEVV